MDNFKKFMEDFSKDDYSNEEKVFNMSEGKQRFIKNDPYFKDYKIEKVPIDQLIKDNDLDNRVALSNHAATWSTTGGEDGVDPSKLEYNEEKDRNDSDIIYGTNKLGKYKLSNGRHRVRALKNAGYTHINVPIYSSDSKSTKPEVTAKNAEAFAKREMLKYFDQAGAYGGIPGMIDTAGEQYHLRDDEKAWLKTQLEKFVDSNEMFKGFESRWKK